jgi:hypothetical protein
VEGTVQGVAKAKEAFQVKAAGFIDEATQVDAAARKLGLSRTDIGRALDGQLDTLKPDVRAKLTQAVLDDRDGSGKISVLDGWRRLFKEAREEIQAGGYDIGEIQDYVPLKALRGVDLAERMRDTYTSLQRQALAGKTSILKLAGEEAQDFRTMAGRVLRKDAEKLTEGDLTSVAKLALQQGKTTPTYTPSAVFERLGSVPDGFREYDVGKLFTGYINGNLKAVHFDTALKQVQSHITAFRAAGLPEAATFFERHLADVTGASSRGLAGAMRDAGLSLRNAGRTLQGSDSAAARAAGHVVEGIPEFAGWANGLVYPSYLGLPNLKAPLRNVTQPVFKTLPEIGWRAATKWTFQAYAEVGAEMKAAAKAGKNPFTHMDDQLKAAGLSGQHIMANLDVEPGMASGARQVVDKFNSKIMALYSQTDTINRAVTAKMGQQWAKAVLAGDKSAIQALDRLGPGMRAQLKADGLGDAAALGHKLGDCLIGRTQFRYGKELQSEFGRTMGPLFTMFTKWPTMVAADVLDGFDKSKLQGTKDLITKYLAPLGALYAVEHALTASGGDHNTAFKVYVGDLPSLSPADTVMHPFKTIDGLGGPMVQLGREALDAAGDIGGDRGDDKARTVVRHVLKGYAPVVAPILNELDRWSNARNPKQPTPTRDFVNKLPLIGQ